MLPVRGEQSVHKVNRGNSLLEIILSMTLYPDSAKRIFEEQWEDSYRLDSNLARLLNRGGSLRGPTTPPLRRRGGEGCTARASALWAAEGACRTDLGRVERTAWDGAIRTTWTGESRRQPPPQIRPPYWAPLRRRASSARANCTGGCGAGELDLLIGFTTRLRSFSLLPAPLDRRMQILLHP